MLFNSVHFAIFFPIVVVAYFALPQRMRWMLLLAASYYFYMAWEPSYVVLLLAATVINYWAGLKMGESGSLAARRTYLVLGVSTSLGILFFYKYFNLFNDTMRGVFDGLDVFYGVPDLHVLLPVGISFYTFQTLSYTIDVYRGEKGPERHFGIFALYVSFFPQLVAGPIERSTRLLPQFYEEHEFDYGRVTAGLKLMVWGFFKKLVIADRLAIYVNQVYEAPQEFTGPVLIIATVFFAYQIYCDFSGYSDIAIGASRIMGYDLMVNFRHPYVSKSIREFWHRCHISLSTWFRDYLYIPLGGNRVGKWRWYYNLFITFVISGLWHGANWSFVVWGALHGFYQLFAIWTADLRHAATEAIGLAGVPKLHGAVKIAVTFSLAVFAWIFFRADTIQDALYVAGHLASGFGATTDIYLSMGPYEFWIGVIAIALLETVHAMQRRGDIIGVLAARPLVMRWAVYYAAVIGILVFGEFGGQEFVYFQF